MRCLSCFRSRVGIGGAGVGSPGVLRPSPLVEDRPLALLVLDWQVRCVPLFLSKVLTGEGQDPVGRLERARYLGLARVQLPARRSWGRLK